MNDKQAKLNQLVQWAIANGFYFNSKCYLDYGECLKQNTVCLFFCLFSGY